MTEGVSKLKLKDTIKEAYIGDITHTQEKLEKENKLEE